METSNFNGIIAKILANSDDVPFFYTKEISQTDIVDRLVEMYEGENPKKSHCQQSALSGLADS